ncbi:MAG: FHA domain-containing protein [Deltaproteobacteria bacterium]|nr:FHA domain-containing protein [Deltaproteobacteria bacterium]
MIIFCEECGAKNNLESGTLSSTVQKAGSLKCHNCGDTLVISPVRDFPSQLELRFKDQAIQVNKKRSIVTMGRDPENDIVIKNRLVSRSHAVILCRKDRFVLIDESKNGTYIRIQGEKDTAVDRDMEFQLSGQGIISPGQKVVPNSRNIIQFSIRKGN